MLTFFMLAAVAFAVGWGVAHLVRRTDARIATVTHELRTPITGVVGMTDLLLATEMSPEQTAYVKAIRGSAESLRAMTDDLLDAAAIEAGRFQPGEAAFAPALLVEEIVELLAPHAHAKGLEIAGFAAPEVPPALTGDAGRLRQILLNLVGNAVKYTSKGGVGLRIDAAPGGIAFSVHDTGPGIAEGELPRLLQRFTRGAAGAHASGTGLGLSITRQLIEQLGGTLQVHSRMGAGTTFSATLPMRGVAAPAVEPWLRGGRVLLVSRSLFEAPWLAETLGAAGAEVTLRDTFDPDLPGAGWPLVILDETARQDCLERGIDLTRSAARVVHLLTPQERRAMGEDALRRLGNHLMRPVRARSLRNLLAEPPAALPLPPTRPAAQAQPVAEPRPRALVIEDDAVNALLARTRLEQAGWAVTMAADGDEGVAMFRTALREKPFALVLADMELPRRSGLETVQALRALEREEGAGAVPVIIITATPERVPPQMTVPGMADGVTEKPLDPARLDDLLEAAFRRRKTA